MESATLCRSGPGTLEEQVRALELHPCGNTARYPVVDSLRAAFGVPQEFSDLGRAAERIDQFSVFHSPIKHGVYGSVNTACINVLLNRRTILTMEKKVHESMRRLLAAARDATDNDGIDFAAIGKRLKQSPAVITNWKERGVSAVGAVLAEQAYGCSPSWVLHGKLPASAKPKGIKSFSDRSPVSTSQWAILDAIEALPEEAKHQRIDAILEEGKKWKAISDELVAKAKGAGR